MTGEGCRDLPLVVCLVQAFVQELGVQSPVNPIDQGVGEKNEGHAVQ